MTDFLDNFVHPSLVDQTFINVVGDGDGDSRFERLLTAVDCKDDSHGFFKALLSLLGEMSGNGPVTFNNVTFPHLAIMAVLDEALPGDKFVSIKDIDQLEKLTNIAVATEEREDMQEVLETYPVRLSMHTIRQMRISNNVAYQYMPFTEELDKVGHTNTWIGQFHQGLLEQMYANRVIFLLNMSCPVYCRFCFRKHKESRNEANPSEKDIIKAVEHIHNSPAVKEIVVTGGDPFMSRRNMASAINNLADVEHVRTLRLATRSIAYFPHLFLDGDGEYLSWLKEKNLALQQKGKRMEVATHFIHPDEVSPQSLTIINDLVRNGIAVYIQTPFLKDCNDKGPELVRLFGLLRGAGAEMHYIYIPCSPIHGNSIYWSPISSGISIAGYLRAHLSDRAIPSICTATPIGKMDWFTSGWAVEPVADNEDLVWIRTPYTPEYFKSFAPLTSKLDNIRINDEGTIDIQYFAQMGDDNLFIGALPPAEADKNPASMATPPSTQELLQKDLCLLDSSVVDTNTDHLCRQHETRVELTLEAGDAEIEYISTDRRITDVVLSDENDPITRLNRVVEVVRRVADIPHVNCVRIRSLMFNHSPERFSRAAIDNLAYLNRLSLVGPLRLEIETRFYQAGEITEHHSRVVRDLNNRGITVYNNTPLISGINDTAEEIHGLAFSLRQAGIEFHHLYVAGLPQQDALNYARPVHMRDLIDIASTVRREGSGREIPRYIIRTALGEVDYGLTSAFEHDETSVWVRLLPYNLAYFQSMAPGFEWPHDIRVNNEGVPALQVSGLAGTGECPLI
ncbi:MAG: radical SAM protein [Desulfocapsaceae bacterium]